jgi:K+ transporter
MKLRKMPMAGTYDDAMSYQSSFDWTAWDLSSLIAKNKPPPSVRIAVRFMYTGAVVEALVAILGLAIYFRVWRGVVSVSTLQLTPGQLRLAEATGAAVGVGVALARIGMWLWMASKSKAGRSWARVLSTVFFGIDSLALVTGIGRPVPGGHWQLLFPAAVWLVGLCAVALLWRGESSEFFTAQSRRYY